MADTNETIADIIAEMHRRNDGNPMSVMRVAELEDYVDRFDAAHKREMAVSKTETTTNAAKLREAMLSIRADILKRRSENVWYATDSDILEKIDAALAAPPRNCDRFGSSTEARAEWYKTEVLPRVEGVVSGVEPPFVDWLFAPATEKEGGNNAD